MTATVRPAKLAGQMQIPPSKSMAHRMLICSALSRGFSKVGNLDYSVDINATIGALRQLGANIDCGGHSARVEGLPGGFATVTRPVDCRESGSTLRFLVPLFSLTGQKITFTGASYLFKRPLAAYAEIFAQQGLQFGATDRDLVIKGCLRPGEFRLAGNISSQFISGLLFALPLLEKDSVIHIAPPVESRSYIELTRAAQYLYGVTSEWTDNSTLRIPGNQSYTARDTVVEGDWSQAVVPAALGAVLGGISIAGLSEASAQGDRALLDCLARAGAQVEWENGALTVNPPKGGRLQAPGDVDLSDTPDLGPVLCAFALLCEGKTRFVNAGRLRMKECDRIAMVEQELKKLGGRVSSTQDTITVEGGYPLLAGKITQGHNDHRVVMALATAALAGGIDVTIEGADAVRKSWPGFFADIAALGAEVATL